MLKIIKKLIFVIIPFVLIACSTQSKTVEDTPKQGEQYSLKYKGESEHWSAELVVNVSDNEESDIITLTYKGTDIKSVKNIKVSCVLSNGSMSGVREKLNPGGTLVLKGGSENADLPEKEYIVKT